MFKKILLTLCLATFSLPCVKAVDVKKEIVTHLQQVSVSIVTPQGSGSGVLKTRKVGDNYISFCWTAGHVVSGLRHVKTVIDGKTGTPRMLVEFDDALVVRTLIEDGRTIGKTEVFARILKYNAEEDLAVLQVRQKNFSKEGVNFYLDNVTPGLATPVIHVGSFLGELGSSSLSLGIVSQNGRLIDNKVFDQTTATGYPGSSGGGIFSYDGKLIGQVLRGAGSDFILFCPVRRSIQWAKDAKIEWAVNDNVRMPSENDLRRIVVEDNGMNFSNEKSTSQHNKKFKTFFNPKVNLLDYLIK